MLCVHHWFRDISSVAMPILLLLRLTPILFSNLEGHLLQEAFPYLPIQRILLCILLGIDYTLGLISIRALFHILENLYS